MGRGFRNEGDRRPFGPVGVRAATDGAFGEPDPQPWCTAQVDGTGR